jgi:hypothetical protein
MSRISEYEADDTASFLRCCAFEANMKRAVAGKKGQAFLRELEAALLALQEKKLFVGALADAKEEPGQTYPLTYRPVATGGVCALGAVAVARAVSEGKDRMTMLQKLAETYDPSEEGWVLSKEAAHLLKITHPLAWRVIYENDECGARTPEERYEKVLDWVRSKITVT